MNIGCLQFNPTLGDVDANQARADALLRQARELDLLVLPEMAFTGYCFKDRAEIEPFCESCEQGPTATWCRETARRLGCFVACGFPERDGERLYNALILVGPTGETVHVHRKHLLYLTDETWATEGPGFQCRDIAGLGRCAFAICMDLNPKRFEAPFDRYEFASSLFDPALQHREVYRPREHRLAANLVIACNNWLRSEADKELSEEQRQLQLMNYWAARMKPVLGLPIVLVIANRVGTERGTHFAGTSCVIDLKRRAILGHLDGMEEGILIVREAVSYSS